MENDSKEKNNIVKKINDLVTGNVLNNLVYASMITIYFMFFNMYAVFTETEIFIQYIKIASFIFLLFSIFGDCILAVGSTFIFFLFSTN